MKKSLYLTLVLILILSCSTLKTNKVIPYLVSIEAENSIYQAINNLNKEKIAFYFENLSDGKFKVHLIKDGINDKYSFSNRKLFINDKFYPIIFDNDYKFFVKTENNYPIISKFEDESEKKSTVVKMPSIYERIKNRNLYIRDSKINIIDFSIYWIVDTKGNLVETNSNKTD
jgi:hypothetical protein